MTKTKSSKEKPLFEVGDHVRLINNHAMRGIVQKIEDGVVYCGDSFQGGWPVCPEVIEKIP